MTISIFRAITLIDDACKTGRPGVLTDYVLQLHRAISSAETLLIYMKANDARSPRLEDMLEQELKDIKDTP